MKARDISELERYIRWIANEMGLRDWTFHVVIAQPTAKGSDDGSGHEWGAMCTPIPGRKHATLTFHPERRDDELAELRQTVVHELVHCHFFGLWDTCRRDLPLDEEAYEMWIEGVRRHMEYGVDAVADAIAPRMPLIKWPTKGTR